MKKRAFVPVLIAATLAIVMLGGWRCPVLLVLGIPCPTCGMTRAARLALHGDLAGATHLHPLVWLAVPVVAAFLTVEMIGYARTGAFGASRRVRGSNAVMVGTAALLFALWIARFFGDFGGPVT